MHRSPYLFVEQDIFDAPRNTEIVPKGKLTKIACPRVDLQHLLQKNLSLPCAGLDNPAIAEHQAHPLDTMPLKGRWNIKLDNAIRALFNRPGKKFAAWEVALATAMSTLPPVNSTLHFGAYAQNTHAPVPGQPIHIALLLHRNLSPALNRLWIIQETNIEDKFFKLAQRHLGVLRISRRGIERRGPAEVSDLLSPA